MGSLAFEPADEGKGVKPPLTPEAPDFSHGVTHWWNLTRSNVLVLSLDIGKDIGIRSRKFGDLIEIANASKDGSSKKTAKKV